MCHDLNGTALQGVGCLEDEVAILRDVWIARSTIQDNGQCSDCAKDGKDDKKIDPIPIHGLFLAKGI